MYKTLVAALVLCASVFAANPASAEKPEQDYIVVYEPGAEKVPGRNAKHLESHQLVSATPAQAAAIARRPGVVSVTENVEYELTSNDPGFSNLWGIQKIDADEAWTVTDGAGVQIAVIDTCIDIDHPDLQDRYILGYDFIDNDTNPDCPAGDASSHGTHVAGTALATKDNNTGIAGVAPGAQLIAARTVGSSGSGSAFDAMDASAWAAENGADVINLSQGGHQVSDPGWAAVANAYPDVTFVAGAGNGAYNLNDMYHSEGTIPFFPAQANADNMISVGASTSTDGRATFSNYGNRQVDVAAPGTNIYSTMPGGGYGYKQGTSMATPHVAGVAALARARYGLDGAANRNQVLSAAESVTSWTLAGRVNAYNAVATSYWTVWPNDPWVFVPRQCGDGIDNDGDGKVDSADYGCSGGTTDPSERDPVTVLGSMAEGVEGTAVSVPVNLSSAVPYTVIVDWQTINDPANDMYAGVDFVQASGTLTFAPGETTKYITIQTIQDSLDEPGTLYGREWVLVKMSNARVTPTGGQNGARIPGGTWGPYAHAFIIDDD